MLVDFPRLIKEFEKVLNYGRRRLTIEDSNEIGLTSLIKKRRQPFTIEAYIMPQIQLSLVIQKQQYQQEQFPHKIGMPKKSQGPPHAFTSPRINKHLLKSSGSN